MAPASFYDGLARELEGLQAAGGLRELRLLEKLPGKRVRWDGREMVNGSSNDYLGLSTDAGLLEEFYRTFSRHTALAHFSLGAASSRLLTGNQPAVVELEAELARAYSRQAALVFNSGYHANLGILSSLAGPRDVIFSDRLNHASLLDGARLSGAKLIRYPHLDYGHLETQLKKFRGHFRKALIVSESVFSMEGDIADLHRLAGLRNAYDAFLMVDEAHAAGIFGASGLGCCEQQAVIPEIDLLLGTFGKAWGSQGAYAVCDRLVRDYLVNTMRPFIFTTALPPVVAYWNLFVLLRLGRWQSRRQQVLQLAEALRSDLRRNGLATGGCSQIVPVLIGDNPSALRAAQALQDHGLLLLAIRPPTVPANTSRLRISLTAHLEWDDVAKIAEIIKSADVKIAPRLRAEC